MKQYLEKYKKYKEWLNLLWIIPCILILLCIYKQIPFAKFSFKIYNNIKPQFAFSLFNKDITNDTFFTIAIGDYVLENGNDNMDHLTWHENLTFPHSGIFDIFISKLYHLCGFEGLTVFVTCMIFLIGITLFFIIKERTQNWKIALVWTIMAIYLCQNMFVVRAQIISFWLFLLEFWCIEKLLETNHKKYIIILIIIPMILANIHSSVYLVYFILYLPYFAEWILYQFCSKFKRFSICHKFEIENKKYIKTLGIVAGISLFTGLCTTTGLAPYTDMIKAMIGVSTEFIGELEASTLYNNKMFYYILGILLIVIIFTKIKPKITDVFFILGFGMMTIVTYRCLYFFFLIAATPITRIVMLFIKTYHINIPYKIIKVFLIVSSLLLCFLLYGTAFFRNQIKDYVPKERYPVEACDWILDNIHIENMKIFNHFNYGSYLEFRKIPAFIDSRSGMFCEEFNEGVTILEDWLYVKDHPEDCQTIFDKYQITHLLFPLSDDSVEVIRKNGKWKPIYQDDCFILFERIYE